MKRGDLNVTVRQKTARIAHNLFDLVNGKVAGSIECCTVHRKIDDTQADFAFNLGTIDLTCIGRLRCGRAFGKHG